MVRFLSLALCLLIGAAQAQVPFQVGPIIQLPITKPNGGTGGTTGLAAAGNLSLPYVVCQSTTPSSTITGTVTETNAATCPLPANLPPVGGSIVVTQMWNFSGSAGSKTLVTRLSAASGGTAGTPYVNSISIANVNNSAECETNIWIKASNSEVGRGPALCGYGYATSTPATSAIDTTAISYINFNVILPGASDTAILESYRVMIYPQGGN